MKPIFIDNQNGNTLANAIKHYLEQLKDKNKTPEEINIATAYFNPQGFNAIAEGLKNISNIRLLLGAEPTPESMHPIR